MATTLTIPTISAKVAWDFRNEFTWGDATNISSWSYSKKLTDGTAADQANRIYVAATTIAASTTANLDLAGVLEDMYGQTVTFAKIKVMYFEVLTTTAAVSMLIGGHATAAFYSWLNSATDADTDQAAIRVLNGGVFMLGSTNNAGYPVTATTADQLTLTNESSTLTLHYRCAIVGTAT